MKTYTCANGHRIEMVQGDWITMAVEIGSPSRSTNYNYCMECFGEWAQKKWPLTCEEVVAAS